MKGKVTVLLQELLEILEMKQNQEEYNITKEKDKEINKEEFLKRNQLKKE